MVRPSNNQETGRQAEELAASFLLVQGYAVKARNLFMAGGEIDILAEHLGEIVAVEVKYSRSDRHFQPIDRVDWRKRRRLQIVLGALAVRYPDKGIRLDVVTVAGSLESPTIKVYRDAFG